MTGQAGILFLGKVYALNLAGAAAAFFTACSIAGSIPKACELSVSIFIPLGPSVAGFLGGGELVAALEASQLYQENKDKFVIRALAGSLEIAVPLGLGISAFMAGLLPLNAINPSIASVTTEQFFPILGGALITGKAAEFAIKKYSGESSLTAAQQLLVVSLQAVVILVGNMLAAKLLAGDLTANLPGAATFITVLLSLWAMNNFVLKPAAPLPSTAVRGSFSSVAGLEGGDGAGADAPLMIGVREDRAALP